MSEWPAAAATCLQAPAFECIPRDDDGPVFAQPWQAQAFALTVRLAAAGCFTWTEWASTLGEQFSAAAARGEPDDGTHYYEHWLSALESLVTRKGWTSIAALAVRKDEWVAAHLATPHGHPVELETARRA